MNDLYKARLKILLSKPVRLETGIIVTWQFFIDHAISKNNILIQGRSRRKEKIEPILITSFGRYTVPKMIYDFAECPYEN